MTQLIMEEVYGAQIAKEVHEITWSMTAYNSKSRESMYANVLPILPAGQLLAK